MVRSLPLWFGVVSTLVLAFPLPGPSGVAWAQTPPEGPGGGRTVPDGTGDGDPAGPGLDELEGLEDELEALDDLEGIVSEGEVGGLRLRSFKGFGETTFRSYLRDRDRGKEDEQWLWELQMEADLDLGRGFSGYLRPRFLLDALDSDLLRLEPLEAYVTLGGKTWDARLGQIVESWGIADAFNPVDILNRRDIGTDILDPPRLGELGARFRYFLAGGELIGEPGISLYVIPTFRRASFPTEGSRWSLSQPPFELKEEDDITPKGEDRIFLAIRGQSTLNTSLANADLQVLLARGPEHFPLLAARPQSTGKIHLAPIYYGVWTAGGGIRAVPNAEGWSRATLKAEVVYRAPYRTGDEPRDLPESYTPFVFGLDWLFPRVLGTGDQVTATVEYLGEAGADDPTSEFRPFRSDLALRLFWEANDFSRTSVEVRGVIDVASGEIIAEGILERQLRFLHDDLQLRIGAQVFDPDRSKPGFFGFFPDNSNVSAALRCDF